MIGALTNHLWQSTLFVLAAGLVAAALRKNGAHIRYRIWLIASLKFLVPFSVLLSLGSALPLFAHATPATAMSSTPDLSITVDRITQPFTSDVFASPAETTARPATNWTPIILAGVWACGFVAVGFMRFRGWRHICDAVRASVPVEIRSADRIWVRVRPVPVRSSPGLLEPGVVGLWHPVLLLPAGIETHLTPSQLEAVMVHELCHVARRDNLTSAIHMVVEAVFWFHPLVWWVGARLVDERERACDEHVLRVCGEPTTYAESILNVCKLYVESPLACVSGVTGHASPKRFFGGGGSDLKRRVAAIMGNRIGLQLNFARKAALVAVATLAVGLPLVAGMLIAPLSALAEAPASADGLATAGKQSAKADQKFDVASIKPCEPVSAPDPGQRARSGGAGISPGYLFLNCMTLRQLVLISTGKTNDPASYLLDRAEGGFKSVRGGPSWVDSDRFTIEAKSNTVTDRDTLTGPMLRALLEDRFQLKTRRATEDKSVYALKVAAGGLKLTPVAPESCYEYDFKNALAGVPGKPLKPGQQLCGTLNRRSGPFRANAAKIGKAPAAPGTSLSDFLSSIMDRAVFDQTGLDGRYDVEFNYAPDETTPGWRTSSPVPETEVPPSGPNIFKALEMLGLKLEPTKWPAEYLAIDHAERPKPDAPSAIVPRPVGPASPFEARRGGGR